METNKQRVTVTVPPDLMAKLQAQADALGITVQQHASALVSEALQDSINLENKE